MGSVSRHHPDWIGNKRLALSQRDTLRENSHAQSAELMFSEELLTQNKGIGCVNTLFMHTLIANTCAPDVFLVLFRLCY